MYCLEDKLSPPPVSSAWRDLFCVGLLAALAAILMSAWDISESRYVSDFAGQMASYYLPPALGFMLALRFGAIDLSVWLSSAIGGLVALACIKAGTGPAAAALCAVAAGLALGAFNGVWIAKARMPGIIVTFIVAVAGTLLLRWLVGVREVHMPEHLLDSWAVVPHVPLLFLRMLFVMFVYALTMAVLLTVDVMAVRGVRINRRWGLFAAMCASGALSAAGGVCWVIHHGTAPILTRPIGDLRIAAAAILAGGAFLAGRTRTLLAGVFLPVALLVATVWRQEVWDLSAHGYALGVLVLIGMTVVIQIAGGGVGSSRGKGKILFSAVAFLAVAGLLILTAAVWAPNYAVRKAFHFAGVLVWLAGALGLLVLRLMRIR